MEYETMMAKRSKKKVFGRGCQLNKINRSLLPVISLDEKKNAIRPISLGLTPESNVEKNPTTTQSHIVLC